MAKTAILAVKVIGDASGAAKALDETGNAAGRMGGRLQTASRGATIVGAALIGVAIAANKQASELQQANGAAQAVFGSQAKAVQNLAKQSATSLGIARSEYTQTAAVVGSQLKNMGVAQSQLVPKTDALIKLGGDLAATYGGTTSQAVQALSSLLRGETDPIEQYGVSIKQADIAAQLAAKGQDKLTGAAKKTAQTEALLALLTKQTSAAQGQRARESESFAQRQEVAIAKAKDAGAQFGTALLPMFTAIATAMASVADFAVQHQTLFTVLAAVIAAMAAAVLITNAAYQVYLATTRIAVVVTKAWTIAQKALNIALRLNPIGLIITAIALLVAGIILAYKNSATFRAIITALGVSGKAAIGLVVAAAIQLWTWIKALGPAVTVVKNLFVTGFKLLTAPIVTVINLVKSLIGWIKKLKFPSIPKGFLSLFGRGGPPAIVAGGHGGASRSAYSSLPGRGGPGGSGFLTTMGGRLGTTTLVNITVEGALDPEGVARQIGTLLRRQNIRLGQAW